MTERMQRPNIETLDTVEQPLMKIKFGYGHCMILPWDKGQEVLSLMSAGEVFKDGNIVPAGSETYNEPEITMMSRSEYRNRKMAHLLKIDYADLVNKDRNPDDDNLPIPF